MPPANPKPNTTGPARRSWQPTPKKKPIAKGKWLAIFGACLYATSLVVLVWSVIEMRKAFDIHWAESVESHAQLANYIRGVMIGTSIGITGGVTGVALIFVSLLRCHYRASWFFWFLIMSGVIGMCAFPVGTVIGIIILIYSLTHRQQFMTSPGIQ